MMSETIKGKYKYFSEKEGKLPGICVDDKWYNFGPDKLDLFNSLKDKKGAEVELETALGQIISIKVTKEPEKKSWSGNKFKPIDKYDNSAFYNGCMINAVQYIGNAPDQLPAKQWAQLVANYTKELVNEIKTQQSFGQPTTQTSSIVSETKSPEVKNDATEEKVKDII